MSISSAFDQVKDVANRYTKEVLCLAAATLAYRLFRKNQHKNEHKKDQKDQNRLQEPRPVKINRIKSFQLPHNILHTENSLIDQVKHLSNPACKITRVPHLIQELDFRKIPSIKSPLIGDNAYKNSFGGQGFLPQEAFVYQGSYVLQKNMFDQQEDLINPKCWLLAGPRKYLHFKPANVKAAIVTCGGLCPGLNVVVREIYTALANLYGCSEIWGIKFGYMGFYSGGEYWIKLNQKFVRELQYQGGTIFGSSRGGFNQKPSAKQTKTMLDVIKKQLNVAEETAEVKNRLKKWSQQRQEELTRANGNRIIEALMQKGINQLYILGGDGTHRGIVKLCQIIKEKKLQISICGIPKTIDNDIPIIDKTFGFETAVAESIRAIRSAYVESRGVDYGIGLVRLMGRDAGWIAMEATNASRDVDICLIPQFKFDLYGESGVFQYIWEQLKLKHHLVIVVAEGAGSGVRDLESLGAQAERDASGNIKPPDIGVFLKKAIVDYCKDKGMFATLKYIDPAYMIRTVPANSSDRKMCAHLATSAVHGAMAGFTSFTVGHINQHVALIPVTSLGAPRHVTSQSRAWHRVLATTGQPFFLNEKK